jgi:hypothetical protein
MCPAAYQNTAVIQIRVNKIPTNFDTLFVTSLDGIWLFRGLNERRIYMSFGVKGLMVHTGTSLPLLYSQQILQQLG